MCKYPEGKKKYVARREVEGISKTLRGLVYQGVGLSLLPLYRRKAAWLI